MSVAVRRCEKCGFETQDKINQCPQCGRRLISSTVLRTLGGIQLALGLTLIVGMGVLTLNLAPSLLQPGKMEEGMRFSGSRDTGLLILGLFGLVMAFGFTSTVSGLWQIITGRRNKWIVAAALIVFILLIIAVWITQSALGR